MNSRIDALPPWACRISLIVILLCLPLIACLGYSLLEIDCLASDHENAQLRFQEIKKVEAEIKANARQKNKFMSNSPSFQKLYPFGLVLNEEISLLRLDSDFKSQTVDFEVVATSLPELLDFVSRVQHIPMRVELKNHQYVKEKNQAWPVRATMKVYLPKEKSNE
ncbi:hypothetical protein [Serratia sp. 1D1416]|uniref:hypothetical protein n=1 Tax=Serratia sp. 1D1416 TaxID=2447890 RepID=UPI001013C884|nr:hypothetical protein [Serratia sp. 1D1416]